MSWKPGDRLVHRHNPALGPGRVSAVEGRTVVVEFPASETTLRLASGSTAIVPLVFAPGAAALHEASGRRVLVTERIGGDRYRLEDGTEVAATELWPVEVIDSPLERLVRGEIDPIEDVANRLDALHLAAVRESSGFGSFLGGRIRLFPHQLYVAERAARADPVRWLLADEVGLGKTVEACLVLNHLVRTGRAARTLVVAPATLVVQWLGELWRKYHHVFVLLDEKRLADVARDFGPRFNPFDTHTRAVIALETLVERPELVQQAVAAGLDALVVDEAHHLRRPPGHPGEPAYRAVAPLTAAARHVLLLTATPLEQDAHGFFRLLQLLRPDELPEGMDFEERLARGDPLPPCTSATRRADIGGLPPRVPQPVDLDDEGWAPIGSLVEAVGAARAEHAVARRAKADRLRRALASGASLLAVLEKKETALRHLAREAVEADPRVAWLADRARAWRDAGDKSLVFVAERETLEMLQTALSRRVQLRTGVFHEDMLPGQRDLEVAQFRQQGGPSLLLSTECGGEGRNFEFCRRIVLFDLPWSPTVVEQRIGRLDRIGRARPVEIVFFRPPSGLGATVARLYESLRIFEEPLGGVDRELGQVEETLRGFALGEGTEHEMLQAVARARAARDHVQLAAEHALHRDPYAPDMADSILARVPDDLDERTEEVVRTACERLGLHVEQGRGASVWSIELGHRAFVESLPGVPAGASYVGTFSREDAVEDESIDFFSSGHPLVEGIFAELEDGPRGRVGLLHADAAPGTDESGFGLLAVYKDGPRFEPVAWDLSGRERGDWAQRLTRQPLRSRRIDAEAWTETPGWAETFRRLGERIDTSRTLSFVAAFRIGR